MRRRCFKQTRSLEERLSEEAKRLREEAKLLPPGAQREALLRRARLAQLYNRRFALHQRVKALACQLAELENLRDRVVRAEQRTLCTTRLAKKRFARSARAQMHRTAARCRTVLAHPPSDRR
jgi:hypothetical protein